MKVQIEAAGPVEKKLSFEIPGEIVSQEVDSTYKTLNKNVKIKGFRPGKVPRSILERYYRAQVENEVIAKLIEDSFGKAVEEHQLAPVAAPTLLDRTFEAGKDFKYTVSVEVKPEVSVEGYLGLEVEKPAAAVSEEEVEARLQAIRESHAQLKPIGTERPIQEKDMVILDFEGRLEGKPLEGWQAKDHLVEAGSKTLVGDLDQKLIGLSPGDERDLPVSFPPEDSRKDLAGKEITVRVRVKEIKEKILPSLDDDFAKEVGEFQTLQELKDRLRKSLEDQQEAQSAQAAKERLMDQLREKNSFPLPKSLVERQVENILARTELQLARQGMKLEAAGMDPQKLRENLRPAAEKEVRGSLILEKVAETEKITVDDSELEGRLEGLAARMNQRPEAVKSYYQKKDRLEDLRAMMREEKTLDFLLNRAKIIEGQRAPEEGK